MKCGIFLNRAYFGDFVVALKISRQGQWYITAITLNVVGSANIFVAATQLEGGGRIHIDIINLLLITFARGNFFNVDFLDNEILGFDENLAEVT